MTSSLSKAAQAYRSVSLESRVASSTGSELVSLLFEGFLDRVKLAKLALELGDVNARVLHLGKALQILSEGLRTHLDLIESVAQAWKQNWVDANTNHALDPAAASGGLGMFANQIKGFSGLAAYASSAQAGG